MSIDLTNLCYYDKRNPDCSADDEDIEGHKRSLLKKNKTCSCDNCFYGRSDLTEQLILQQERMYSEEDLREAFKQSRQAKIFEILEKMKLEVITLDEAQRQLCVLFDVIQRSEQLPCEHGNYRAGHSPFVPCICNDCGEEL
jgi:hypothetical protein